MAYQNFFSCGNNFKRKTPAQCSGKNVDACFRMRKDGESALVVDISGVLNDDNTLTTRVFVYDPNTGEKVATFEFDTER